MRRLFALALAVTAALAGAAPGSASAEGDNGAQDCVIFAGAGTPLTNGYFFPGTGVENNGKVDGVPMQCARGSNVTFVNLDPATLTNGHKIKSFKRRGRKPVFQSPLVNGPGTATMITSHLKRGVYSYYCPVHSTMYGLLEVV